jgi:hypothetical protein
VKPRLVPRVRGGHDRPEHAHCTPILFRMSPHSPPHTFRTLPCTTPHVSPLQRHHMCPLFNPFWGISNKTCQTMSCAVILRLPTNLPPHRIARDRRSQPAMGHCSQLQASHRPYPTRWTLPTHLPPESYTKSGRSESRAGFQAHNVYSTIVY